MSGKNLTFKLILDGDSKGLVSAAKESQAIVNKVFETIKAEAEKIKQATESASKEIGNIVPKGTSELADKLTQSLNAATGIIKNAGDNAKSTANNFTDFGNKAEKALSQLKADLSQAKQKLQEFAATNVSPADIEKAKAQVDQLEKEVQQADQAFIGFQQEVGKANTKLNETNSAADKAKQGFSTVKAAVGTLAAGLAGLGLGLTVKELLQTADATQQMGERIKNATSSTEEYNMVQARLLELANKTFRPIQEAQEVYLATSGTMKSLGYSTEQILAVTESLSLSFTHNATRADQASSAQDALAKSMAKGSVDADAWMSIITGADNVVKDMAESTGRTEEEIRLLGASGKASIKELTTALIESRDRNEELASSMKNSTADAAVALKNNLTDLIGKLNEKHQISARLSEAMLTLGSDMGWLSTLFEDAISTVEAITERYSELDAETAALKGSLSAMYDLFKELVAGAWELGKTIDDVLGTALSSFTSLLTSFVGEASASGEQVSFLTRVLQGLTLVFGMVEDGISGIKIGLSLITGAFYSLASAANSVMAALTWGDVSKQFAANADLMKEKATQYYAEADKQAMDFKSKYIQRLEEMSKTEQQKNQEKADSAKATLEKIDADETASAQKRIKAADEYAKAAIAANEGVLSEQLKAELAAKGYAVAMDEAGKVTVSALDAAGQKLTEAQQKTEAIKVATENLKKADEEYLAFQKSAAIERAALEQQIQQAKASGNLNELKQAQDKINQINIKEQDLQANRNQRQTELLALNHKTADGSATAYTRASELAQKFGVDLDKSLNKVSEQFTKSGEDIDKLGGELKELGVTGDQTGNILYQAWLKWLESAKSQAEIDAAKVKLKEFGDQGKVSTSQVEQGLIAIKLQAQKLPDDIDPVTASFKRLGIETKENLKLAAQQALMDFINVRDSGKATAEGVQKAYEKAAQSAAASGDAGRIAAVNAMNAGRNLEVQIDSTGKASVKSMSDLEVAITRAGGSFKNIEDGARSAGSVMREEAQSAGDAWQAAVEKSNKEFKAEMKRQGESLSKGIYDYSSYSKADVLSQLKSKGYSDKDAEKLAGSIWTKAMEADRAAKEQGLGKDGNLGIKALINQEFDAAAAKGLTTQWGTNKINELLRQLNSNSLVSTGPSAKSVDVNSLAPNVNINAPTPNTSSEPKNTTRIELVSGNKTATVYADPSSGNALQEMLRELETLKKSS